MENKKIDWKMIEQALDRWYAKKIELSNDFTNLRPICSFVYELIADELTIDTEHKNEYLAYVKKIEQDLFDRGIIPFKIEYQEDMEKVGTAHDSVIERLYWGLFYARKSYGEEIPWKELDLFMMKYL